MKKLILFLLLATISIATSAQLLGPTTSISWKQGRWQLDPITLEWWPNCDWRPGDLCTITVYAKNINTNPGWHTGLVDINVTHTDSLTNEEVECTVCIGNKFIMPKIKNQIGGFLFIIKEGEIFTKTDEYYKGKYYILKL